MRTQEEVQIWVDAGTDEINKTRERIAYDQQRLSDLLKEQAIRNALLDLFKARNQRDSEPFIPQDEVEQQQIKPENVMK